MNQLEETIEQYTNLFSQIENKNVSIQDIVSDDVEFQDPFHHTFGLSEFKAMLLKTAKTVKHPCFEITHTFWDRDLCIVRWNFTGNNRLLGMLAFSGMSEIHFDEDNKVLRHIDYWDSARNIYKRLPVVKQILNLFR